MNVIRDTTAGGNLGSSLGKGLGEGLQILAEHRMKTIMDQKAKMEKKKGLKALNMFTDEQVEGLSNLPDKLLGTTLQSLYKGYYGAQEGGAQGEQGQQGEPQNFQTPITQQLAGPQAGTQEPGKPTVQQMISAGQKPANAGLPQELSEILSGGKKFTQTPELITEKGPQKITDVGNIAKQLPKAKPSKKLNVDELQNLVQAQSKRNEAFAPKEPQAQQQVEQASSQPQQPAAQQNINTNNFEKYKYTNNPKEMQQNFKDNKKYLATLSSKAKGVAENNRILKEMEKLNNTGKIMGRGKHYLLNFVGSKVGGKEGGKDLVDLFSNEETQRFNKLIMQFLRGAKDMFGSRPTQWDIQSMMTAFPRLAQSEPGRREIIRDCIKINKSLEMEHDIASNIVKKEGIPSRYDLSLVVGDQVKQREGELALGEPERGGPERFIVGKEYTNKTTGEKGIWNGKGMDPVSKGK
jgi:hypothetical protein